MKLNTVLPLTKAEKDRLEYQHYKKLGICPKCKKNKPEPGRVSCGACLEKARKVNKVKINIHKCLKILS
ncbi:MAG: hypothetical protein ACM3X9_12185, partial [Bacillota bacterium]